MKQEPEIYVKMGEEEKVGTLEKVQGNIKRNSLIQIFQPDLCRITLTATVLAIRARSNRCLSIAGSLPYVLVDSGFLSELCSSGYVNDWLGRRRTFMVFAHSLNVLFIFLYVRIPTAANLLLLVLGVPLGIFSGFGSYLAEVFSNCARGAGQGFIYNFGRGIGALPSYYYRPVVDFYRA
jgi:hypothetical protein